MRPKLWYRLSMLALIVMSSVIFYSHPMLWGYPNFLSPSTAGFLLGLWVATEMNRA